MDMDITDTDNELNMPFSLIVPEEVRSVRIDKYISENIKDYSRAYIQKLIDDKYVLINDIPVTKNYKVKSGDIIEISFPEPVAVDILPENIPLDVVYEDNDLIVINKPKGMVVHPAAGHYTGTLVNALMYHCGDSLSSINGVLRPGIVHRIDRDTTGLLVACKSNPAHLGLAEQFKIHSITRKYLAIVYNNFSNEEGTINKPLARSKTDRKKIAVDPNGRRAVTHYKVIKRLKSNFTLIECVLETGRTHQIRVHMASINHPLLGDPLYGPKHSPFNLSGQMLHAGVLGFVHPITGKYMEFESEPSEEFKNILNKI